MNDPNIYRTDGRRLIADGGAAAAQQGGGGPAINDAGGLDSDEAGIQRAEDMEGGGSGFDQLVAHSQYQLAEFHGNERLAAQAKQVWGQLRANSQLRKDEWEVLDDALTRVATQTRVMVQDLISAGLTVPLDLGALRFEWEEVSDVGEAQVDMGADTGGGEDTGDFGLNGVPLPLVHKSFSINLRKLRASRNRGEPLDTTLATQTTRAVNEKMEDILANGVSGLTVQGDSVDGYTNHSDRGTVTGNATWDGATADNMIDDVMRTIESIEDQNRGGVDMMFYIGRQPFQEIRATNSGTDDKRGVLEQVRRRLESEGDFPGVTFKRADFLDDTEAVCVEMSEETIQLANPADVQLVEWESLGGMRQHFKVFGSFIPILKSDTNSNMGLAHLTGI